IGTAGDGHGVEAGVAQRLGDLGRASTDGADHEDALVRREFVDAFVELVHGDQRHPRQPFFDPLLMPAYVEDEYIVGFECFRGVRFDRYANTRIKGALLDELRRADWATRSVRARARQVATVTEKLTPLLGRTPGPVEIAGALGWDPRDVVEVAENVNRAVVLTFDGMTAD